MDYRHLAKSGVQVSAFSLGSWVTFGEQITDDVAADLMKTAYDAGINFFDNAEAYAGGRSETVMGKILRDMGWSHETFLVSSKVFWGGQHNDRPAQPNEEGLSRKHVIAACHNALRRLQVDFLDFYLCHRPDPSTPIEETARAMSDLVTQGNVLYWGTSEWSAQEIMQAHLIARECHLVPPTMEQPQYNLFHRRRVDQEYARLYTEYGLGTTVWSPLGSGLLTGKHRAGPLPGTRAITVKDLGWLKSNLERFAITKREQLDQLEKLANETGLSLIHFSLAWCLKNPNVCTVILGASKVSQLKENLQAMEAVSKLTPDIMKRIDDFMPVDSVI